MKTERVLFLALVLMGTFCSFHAAAMEDVTFVRQEQAARSREREAFRDRLFRDTFKPIETEEKSGEVPPVSSVSFYVKQVVLDNPSEELSFLDDIASRDTGHNMTAGDVERLVSRMNRKLMDKGYITSRVMVPEQNLSGGVLRLSIFPGRLGHVRYAEGSERLPWRNAVPLREGDLLNIRLLEQGLEQMKRLQSLDVSMKLLPGAEQETDVELSIRRRKQVWGLISLDDSGMKETGKYQWTGTLGIDRPTNSNDILVLSAGLDGSRDGYDRSTRDLGLYYSIPFGKDTFTIRHNRYHYHQTVTSIPYEFNSEGKTRITRFTFDHEISRSATEKRDWDITVAKRDSHYYINHMEIPVQAMDTTSLEVGLSDRIYLGNSTLYLRLAHRQGMGWLGAQKESPYSDGPKTRYKMWLVDMDYKKPFTLGRRPASWTASFHGQWNTAGNRLYGVDMVSIGNRYTVWGFDGEYTLMGESGWYLRNELSSAISRFHSEAYVGLDVGAVYGPSTDMLVGRTLSGMALGLRGTFSSGLSYDGFISRSIYLPEGYHTRRWVPGFTVSWRF